MNGIQSRMARAALGWGVRDLARAAKISTQTVTRLEAGEQLREETIAKVEEVLRAAGVELIPDTGAGVGVRFADTTKTTE